MSFVETETETRKVYWLGTVKEDDFGRIITNCFIDGKTTFKGNPWAIMTPDSWFEHGYGKLGTGYGQRYVRQADGRFLKVEG